jgi:hypothetical protein
VPAKPADTPAQQRRDAFLANPGNTLDMLRDKNKQQHIGATVVLRLGHQRESTLDNSDINCTATHVDVGAAKDLYLTAKHCVVDAALQEAGLEDKEYDIAPVEGNKYFSAWQDQSQPHHVEPPVKIGEVDKIIVHGHAREKDLALLHIPGGESIPAVPIENDNVGNDASKRAPHRYQTVGHAGSNPWSWTDFYEITYQRSLDASSVAPELAPKLPYEVFAYQLSGLTDPAENDRLKSVFSPGNSGSLVVDGELEVGQGILSRMDPQPRTEVSAIGDFAFASRDILKPYIDALN